MATTIKQRLKCFNGTDYDTIHLETDIVQVISASASYVSPLDCGLGSYRTPTVTNETLNTYEFARVTRIACLRDPENQIIPGVTTGIIINFNTNTDETNFRVQIYIPNYTSRTGWDAYLRYHADGWDSVSNWRPWRKLFDLSDQA